MPTATPRKMFLNLPVRDLARTIDFFTHVGFDFDQRFTDESAACMIVNDETYVMLLVQHRFRDFTKKQVADATTQTEMIVGVALDSREEVDELVNRALAAGGQPSNDPMDYGFMYGWSFQDLDGHLWEVIYMDPSALDQ
jgi:predicted lactoylglutathione lyase